MKRLIALRTGVFAGVFILAMCFAISLLHIMQPHSSSEAIVVVPEVSKKEKYTANPDTFLSPQRLEIPKVSLIAPVVAVGLTQSNAMDISEDMNSTAWYKLGPKPGEKGSAVIAGHYGWKDGKGSIFNNLHTLEPGDGISVYDEKGKKVSFIVSRTQKYGLNDDTTNVFKSNDNKAHLNLITCDGIWDYVHQTYLDRLVVFSDAM